MAIKHKLKSISVKEKLAVFIQSDGYDFITACEEAEKIIIEFIKSGDKERIYNSRHSNRAIKLQLN